MTVKRRLSTASNVDKFYRLLFVYILPHLNHRASEEYILIYDDNLKSCFNRKLVWRLFMTILHYHIMPGTKSNFNCSDSMLYVLDSTVIKNVNIWKLGLMRHKR